MRPEYHPRTFEMVGSGQEYGILTPFLKPKLLVCAQRYRDVERSRKGSYPLRPPSNKHRIGAHYGSEKSVSLMQRSGEPGQTAYRRYRAE